MSTRTGVLGFALPAALSVSVLAWAAQGGTLKVTVNYTGPGEVSADHAVYVAVYDSPDMQGGDNIIGTALVSANGATVSIENLSASTVYLSGFYDEQGGYQGGELASGTPAAAYSVDAFGAPSPIAVGVGETVEIEFSFNDAFRMP